MKYLVKTRWPFLSPLTAKKFCTGTSTYLSYMGLTTVKATYRNKGDTFAHLCVHGV